MSAAIALTRVRKAQGALERLARRLPADDLNTLREALRAARGVLETQTLAALAPAETTAS